MYSRQHTKRFTVIVRTLSGIKHISYKEEYWIPKKQEDIEEFDTIEEARTFIDEYKELYSNCNKPIVIEDHYVNKYTGIEKRRLETYGYWGKKDNPDDWKHIAEFVDYSDGKCWWSYMIVDFVDEKILNVGGDKGLFVSMIKWGIKDTFKSLPFKLPKISEGQIKTSLKNKDYFFRKEGEVPEDYIWDGDEEYEGWLQYRWGNGKNSVTYVEPSKKKDIIEEVEEATEEDLEKYLSNYEPIHINDGEEVKFSDDIIEYLKITQKMEEILNKKDIKEFKNKQSW